MKIEVCEQMLAAWLRYVKECQVVETNWRPFPVKNDAKLRDGMSKAEQYFQELKACVLKNEDGETLFKKSTWSQFLSQCEIDVVGVKAKDGVIDELYLVDSAFHENGLNYGDTDKRVVKKILRAILIAYIIFPNIPANIVFVSPICKKKPLQFIESLLGQFKGIIQKYTPDITVTLLFNEDFSKEVFLPLQKIVDDVENDSDLFMRFLKLHSILEKFKDAADCPSIGSHSSANLSSAHTKTARGDNKKIVFATLRNLVDSGLMTCELSDRLCDPDYTKKTFDISGFPLLIKSEDFPASGYQQCRYYTEEITLFGESYKICSQWIPERIRRFESWANNLT